jgi:DNA polymerase-3 subunit gamma/tau
MSYTALYRKLRPKNFSEIIGQEHIVKILTNQLKSGRISHAYLFCGTRGTGKTSTAKVFAKALNCKTPIGIEPCNECSSCVNIDHNNNLDIIEIDAASNNGVDNIRDIREEVKYPPTDGKHKIYIIDEVHMLSTGAFNALLKTLEEPPSHVIFILATTDPQKIPSTILSRCQRLDFHRIPTKIMTEALKDYMEAEGVKIDYKALEYISRICDGAMRDALSLLDQCIAYYYGEEIDIEKVLNVTGSVDNSVFFSLLEALNNFDSTSAIEIIGEAADGGRDINQLVSDFIVCLRNLLVSLSTEKNSMDMSDEAFFDLKKRAEGINKEKIIEYINAFSGAQNQMKYASNPRILLETLCIKLTNPQGMPSSDGELLSRIQRLEKEMEKGPVIIKESTSEKAEKPVKAPVKKAVPADIESVVNNWNDFLGSLGTVLKSLMQKRTYGGYLEGDILCVVADTGMTGVLKSKEEEIKEGLFKKYNREFTVSIMDKDEYDLRHKDKYGAKDENSKVLNKKEISEKLGGFAEFN